MSNADLADFATKERVGLKVGANDWIVLALEWAFVLAVLVFAVPRFEAFFKDFGLDLSGTMKLVVRVSHHWPAVLGIVVV